MYLFLGFQLEPDTILATRIDFVAETCGTHAEPVHKETERECNQMLPSFNLLGNQNQQFEGGTPN
jgi:hypothetical protein